MRLFIAAELDDVVRREAGRLSERLARELEPRGRRSIAWVASANMHLTLRFLGEVDAATASAVSDCLSSPFETPVFRLVTGDVGTFPPSGPPRVVWLGLRSGAEELAVLHREVQARLAGVGFPPEDRAFRAHLTLGRVKGSVGPQFRSVLSNLSSAAVGGCLIDRVTLFESRLSPKGPTYTALARADLTRHPI